MRGKTRIPLKIHTHTHIYIYNYTNTCVCGTQDLISGRDIILAGLEAGDCGLAILDVNLDSVSDVLDLVVITTMIVG